MGNIDLDSKLKEKKGLFEALLFMANEPLPLNFFSKFGNVDKKVAEGILENLIEEKLATGGGIHIYKVTGGYQLGVNPRYRGALKDFITDRSQEKIKKSTLEVLAIIAYKQPVHAASIDEIRGGVSRPHIKLLIDRKLVKHTKRLEILGRPMGYGTTSEFLKYFGLKSLKDLPSLSEIKDFNFDSL